MEASPSTKPVFVVVGGGIAGVSCAEELSMLCPGSSILLISGSPLIKAVTNYTKLSRSLEQFDVSERTGDSLSLTCPNVKVVHTTVNSLNTSLQTVSLANGTVVKYDKLCICTGGIPKLISKDNPFVIGIRDTESVQDFQKRLGNARRIAVIGNGGIAVELVYEVIGCEVVWAIKDKSIGQAFFDEGAATFFLPHLTSSVENSSSKDGDPDQPPHYRVWKRTKYTLSTACEEAGKEREATNVEYGSALGPDWRSHLRMSGREAYRHVHVEYACEVAGILSPLELKARSLRPSTFPSDSAQRRVSRLEERKEEIMPKYSPTNRLKDTSSQAASVEIETQKIDPTKAELLHQRTVSHTASKDSVYEENTDQYPVNYKITDTNEEWPVYVEFTNGKVYGCDIIVSATGVVPNTQWIKLAGKNEKMLDVPELAEDGGIVVDEEMRSNISNVYAAGDVCTVNWSAQSATWFPMRLWTQARQMGAYAARCMDAHFKNDTISLDFCFELFAHVTQFFGYKVVLLGRYNGQGLGNDYEIIIRCTKGLEYLKVILQNGRMVGAILIGETDLEETFENLILNGMDLSRFGESLLDPDIDIEDYFD